MISTKPSRSSWSRGFYTSMELCLNVNTQSGFQFHGEMVIPDGYLFEPASYQRLVKLGKVCSLLSDEILQVVDAFYLLVPCGSVDGGLLAELSKPENLISNFIIGLFTVCLLKSSCCRAISFASMLLRDVACDARMTAAMFSWSEPDSRFCHQASD